MRSAPIAVVAAAAMTTCRTAVEGRVKSPVVTRMAVRWPSISSNAESTKTAAAAPQITLRLVAWGLAGGSLVLVPSLWYLFRVFKSEEASAFERVDTAEYKAPK